MGAIGGLGGVSGVGGIFTPQLSVQLDSALVWLTADDLALSDNDPVSTWANKGTGADFTQTGDKRPLFKASIQNSLGVVRFDGVDDLIDANAALGTGTAGSCFIVASPGTADTEYQYVLTSSDEASNTLYWVLALRNGIGPAENERVSIITNPNGQVDWVYGSTDLAEDQWYITHAGSDGSTWTMNINGAAQTLTLQGAGSANQGEWIGDISDRDNFVVGGQKRLAEGNLFEGDVGEVLFWDSQLSAAQVALVENYLSAKWGITIS